MSKLSLVFIISFFLSGCAGAEKNAEKPVSAQQALNAHLAQWQKTRPEKYSYVFIRSCFCTPEYIKPVLTRVDKNTLIDARFKDSNKPLPASLKGNKRTIDSLFKIVQSAIDRKAYSIKVKYNKQYGYPESISVDYDKMIADEELYLSAKDFKSL